MKGFIFSCEGCWWIRVVVVAEGWSGCGNFLKQNNIAWCCINWLFLSWMISLWCTRLLDSILPTVELLSKLESMLSNPRTALSTNFLYYFKTFVIISTIFTASSPGIVFISGNLFLCSSIWSNSSFVQVYHEIASIQLYLQAPLLILFLFLYLPHMHGCYPWGLKPTSFKFLLMLVFWPLPQITNVLNT